MGPFTFLNGAFLTALAAAALPVLIHLFSRRRAIERPFSHLELLDEITKRKIRRMRLRQWLLLALRTLAIAFLALALSRPVWHGAGAHSKRGSSTVAIIFDDSYSMGARLDPGGLLPVDAGASGMSAPTRFEEARQRALQVIDLLEEGDRAVLVFASSPLRVPYESTVRDPQLLRDEILRARPRATRANLIPALERVYSILASANTLNREIFVISDFQQNQMEEILRGVGARSSADSLGRASDAPADTVLPALVPIPPESRVYLMPVVAPSSPNLALVWALFERDPGGAGGRITARLRNYSDTLIEGQVVQVLGGDDGRLLAEGFVNVDAGAVTQTVVSIEEAPPEGLLMITSGTDLLEIDNTRYLNTTATNRFQVMIVTGGPMADLEVFAEVTYPVLALDPWGGVTQLRNIAEAAEGAGGSSRSGGEEQSSGEALRLFEVTMVPDSDLGQQGEISADAVLLLNVGRLSASAIESLERYRTEGGSIFIALGDRVDARMYNTQILPRLAGLRIENVLGDLRSEAHFSLRPAVTGHDIFEGFPVSPGEALSSARFQRILEVRPGDETRILAEFSGGYPALLEEPGILLFSSSLDLKWSDFPTSASYLPFLHRGLLHLILGGRVGGQEPTVGAPLNHPLSAELERENFRCTGPRGIELPVDVVLGDRGAVLQTSIVPEPGFYRLGAGATPLITPLAVNVDTRESDLVPIDSEQLPLLFGSDATTLAPGETLSRQVLEARYGRELWRLCLTIAFLMLLAESLLARGRLRP